MSIQWLRRHRTAILKGGWSRERSISLKTAAAVEASFKRLRLPFISIDVQPNVDQVLRRKKPDFCFLALHGTFGEDGGIQSLLELLKIPYSGSDALSSAICMDKELSKNLFRQAGVHVIPGLVIEKQEFIHQRSLVLARLSRQFPSKALFIKPVDQGSAIGASYVERPSQIVKAFERCFRVSERALVEKYINGRELTVGILGEMALPVVEIVPEHSFYDFHSKYALGGSTHIVPAALTKKQTELSQHMALKAFRAARCSVVGRVDLMLSQEGQIFVLEINTLPGLTSTSLLPEAARAARLTFDQLVLDIIRLSLEKPH